MAMLAFAIAVVSVGLVNWAAQCLGKQWSLEARLVEGHDLIEDGPYRLVRNPIYTGMFGMLVATGLIGMRWELLVVAVALFVVGTYIRIRAEEQLLRGAFGERFEEYARRVPALIPGIY
jgi:protein-S-isoprenylcysteine O-methyltransferase Ste14